MNEPISETVSPLPCHLDEIRARFEAAWRTGADGTLPRIEDYLAGLSRSDRLALLNELVAVEVACRLQRGEQPRPEEYRARFPELPPEWLAIDPASTQGAGAAQPEALPRKGHTLRCPHCQNPIHLSDTPGDEVLCPGCGGSFRVRDAHFTDTASVSRPLGRFQLLERVGVGAFGAVWKARDTALDRIVALKILHSGVGTDAQELARFQREARAAAQLRHPGIVTVHEVLILDGLPVLVCDFIHGVTLHDLLKVRRLTFRESARLVAQLAEALEYAHGMGVIHRDIKPANVMLESAVLGEGEGNRGESGRPLLMDFGLALRDGAEVTLTLDGHVLGTPAYMSPEQAAGKSHLADRRSDVYSLGVVLYELLTGELPFRGSKGMILYQVLTEEPRPPRQLNPRVPRDLETVCLACLHKEPKKRYATARELADDLKRFLDGEPVRARPVGRAERAWRWCRRNPAVASLLALVALLLISGTVVSTLFALDAAEKARVARDKAEEADGERRNAETLAGERAAALREATEEKGRVQQQLARAEFVAYAFRLREAADEVERGRLDEAAAILHQCDLKLCRWEHDYLRRQITKMRLDIEGHTDGVRGVCFSPDGQFIASGSYDRTVKLWDAHTGHQLLSLKGHTGPVSSVCFSPDGRRIASASQDGTVKVWDAQTGKAVLSLVGHTGPVNGVSFSPDGKRIASGSGRYDHQGRPVFGEVKVWDAQTGQEALTLKGHTGYVLSVAFSPDGKRIASTSGRPLTGEVKLWDAQTGKEMFTFKGHTGPIHSVCFSSDGKRIASASGDHTVRVWDVQTGEALTLLGHTHGVFSVSFSPKNGKRLVSGSEDHTVRVWDAHTGQQLLERKGHTGEVLSVSFSPDGKRIVSGSADRTVKEWDGLTGKEPFWLDGENVPVRSVSFSPDGKRIALPSGDKTVKLWDVLSGREVLELKGDASARWRLSFSPDGKRIAAGCEDRRVQLWDAKTGQETRSLKGHTDRVSSVCFSPDGSRLVSGSFDQTVKVWDVETGRQALDLTGHTSLVSSVSFSPDGNLIVSGSEDQTVRVWDAHTGQHIFSLLGHKNGITSVSFSPDGQWIVSASADRTLKVWDAQTGRPALSLRGHTREVSSVCFSPDGRRIASGSVDKTVKLWDAKTGQEALTLRGHARAVISVSFSPDGQRIASGSEDGTVRMWDAQTGRE